VTEVAFRAQTVADFPEPIVLILLIVLRSDPGEKENDCENENDPNAERGALAANNFTRPSRRVT
jgi:hypothetical protein